MFAFTRRTAGQRVRRRPPRSLQGLSTPNLKRGWGDMKDLSGEEKAELLHGTWRAATPVQLAPALGSRDRDERAPAVAFSTEEAAQAYLDAETTDELAESPASTLALARQFFVDLAATADAEVDAAQMPPAVQSDEERRCEMRDVQREFYGDYYVEQGLVPAALRYAFVDAMLRPSRPLFLVNSVLPLARLTVRDQLEAHSSVTARGSSDGDEGGSASTGAGAAAGLRASSSSPVFTPTPFDPCLYAIPLPPTQALGSALHVPFSAATSSIGARGAEAAAVTLLGPGGSAADRGEGGASEAQAPHAGSSSAAADAAPLIEDADALGLMMSMDAPPAEGDGRDAVEGAQGATAAVASASCSAPAAQPPRLEHLYWLQRQIASDTLLNVDDVSLLVSLLSVRLAAAAAATAPSAAAGTAAPLPPYELILYQAATSGAAAATCFYLTELAQYWYRAVQDVAAAAADNATATAAAARLQRVVIAVEDASLPHDVKAAPRPPRGRGSPPPALAPAPLCESSTAPVADRFPNVVYLPPHAPPLRSRRHTRGRCRVVVCVPSTSQDGVRPRGWLDGGDADEDDTAAAGAPFTPASAQRHAASRRSDAFAGAPPNTFVERCQRANSNFPRLQRQLYDAVRNTRLGCVACSRDSVGDSVGYVVYATQSANVIENEAVVCAVLHRLAEEAERGANAPDRSGASTHLAAPALRVECVPLDAPDLHASLASAEASAVLRRLEREGRRGLDTWVAIEDGAPGQEPGVYSDALRGAVAAAAWRTDPLRSGSDGGFVVCLRVTRAATAKAVREGPGRDDDDVAAVPGPCLWWTNQRSRVVSAVTPATRCFLEDLGRLEAPAWAAAASIVHAGVPCGLAAPAAPLTSAEDGAALPAVTHVSSAVSHVDAVAALRRSLPRLTLSVHALCEVLRLQEVHSRFLRRLLRQREKQSPLQRRGAADGVGDVDVVAETHTFLQAVEACCCGAESRSPSSRAAPSRVYVLLEVDAASLLPTSAASTSTVAVRTSASDEAAADAVGPALHPAVLAEVAAVGVAAEVEWTRRTHGSHAGAAADFSLRLSVPREMPERAKHTAALQEWCVALRDALLYVLRRTGGGHAATASSVRLWADASRESADTARGADGVGDGRGDAVRLPNAAEVLELASDEYEAAPPTALEAHLRFTDNAPTLPEAEDVGDQRADWMRDTNYREWRRRRGAP